MSYQDFDKYENRRPVCFEKIESWVEKKECHYEPPKEECKPPKKEICFEKRDCWFIVEDKDHCGCGPKKACFEKACGWFLVEHKKDGPKDRYEIDDNDFSGAIK